jgi:murein DD-endopeptidase MepM/ murein hydrolase activator NlpD
VNPLLLLGGGGLVAYLLLRHNDAAAATPAPAAPIGPTQPPTTTEQITARPAQPFQGEILAPKPVQLVGRWGWPVPRWQGRAPVVSDGYGSPRPGMTHMGVDLMFARIATDPFLNGTNGSKLFVMPDAWPAVAASDGVLWSAGHTPRGYAVVIDHGNVATFYQHLDTLMVPETKPPSKGTPREQMIHIKAGQPLGVIGGDPLNPPHLKHLHFELWPSGPSSAIDSQPLMKAWQVFTPSDVAPLFALARNAATKKKAEKRGDLVRVRAYERAYPGAALHPPR